MRGAGRALGALAGCGADLVLCGHLHAWRAEPSEAGRGQAPSPLLVQAGTGLSTRVRGEENDFNVLRVRPGEIAVERFVAPEGAPGYAHARSARFLRGPTGWRPADGQDAPAGVAVV